MWQVRSYHKKLISTRRHFWYSLFCFCDPGLKYLFFDKMYQFPPNYGNKSFKFRQLYVMNLTQHTNNWYIYNVSAWKLEIAFYLFKCLFLDINITLFLKKTISIRNLSNLSRSRHFIITRWNIQILKEIKPKYSLSHFFIFQDPSLQHKKVHTFSKKVKIYNKLLLWLSLF